MSCYQAKNSLVFLCSLLRQPGCCRYLLQKEQCCCDLCFLSLRHLKQGLYCSLPTESVQGRLDRSLESLARSHTRPLESKNILFIKHTAINRPGNAWTIFPRLPRTPTLTILLLAATSFGLGFNWNMWLRSWKTRPVWAVLIASFQSSTNRLLWKFISIRTGPED